MTVDCDARQQARRQELIDKMSVYCTPGCRMEKMMMIAADGLSFKKAAAMVKGLDYNTWKWLIALGRGEDPTFEGRDGARIADKRKRRDAVYEMIRSGKSIEEIMDETGITRASVHNYASSYAKYFGVPREELECVKEAEKPKAMKTHHPRVMLIRARKAAGYSGEYMAELLGIGRQMYVAVEAGHKSCSRAGWEMLSEMFELSVAELQQQQEVVLPVGSKISDNV